MTPPIFVSHGSPTLIFDDVPARDFLLQLGQTLPRPKAILVASAHWETPASRVTASPAPQTIHDFGGFAPIMYQQQYPAPGDPALAARVKALLDKAGIPAELDHARGLDHGAWVPLKLSWPGADIPVLQLSLQTHLGPAYHLKLGEALRPLTEEGVLILGSGSLTHDLRSVSWRGPNAEPDWVKSFGDWVNQALIEGRTDDLVNYRKLAPNAARNHPTEEHFLPLFVALGAAGPQPRMELLHTSVTFSVLRMDAFEFAR
ncbi:dioxygenase [Hyphomonas sp. WL0036]|uniref:DODA-type extradiol aromatic ring-opening family dioxygenase n=1 Tax=Hyphomonas sediminis TaxID=2866160 RepID=UPI001C81706D|nr:class III extradiol ring-cleavage dioxygenase [Hyphomonas sediminis]MBY9068312.1 dioxygenase [Hyphomonas sediminis]